MVATRDPPDASARATVFAPAGAGGDAARAPHARTSQAATNRLRTPHLVTPAPSFSLPPPENGRHRLIFRAVIAPATTGNRYPRTRFLLVGRSRPRLESGIHRPHDAPSTPPATHSGSCTVARKRPAVPSAAARAGGQRARLEVQGTGALQVHVVPDPGAGLQGGLAAQRSGHEGCRIDRVAALLHPGDGRIGRDDDRVDLPDGERVAHGGVLRRRPCRFGATHAEVEQAEHVEAGLRRSGPLDHPLRASPARLAVVDAVDRLPRHGVLQPGERRGVRQEHPPRRQCRRHLAVPAGQRHRLHDEGQPFSEDHAHRHERDRSHAQRAQRAPPVGHGAMDVFEDHGQDHGGGQEADRHEALLDHVLHHRDPAQDPGRLHLPLPFAEREGRTHEQDEAEEPQPAVPPEGHRPHHHDGQEAPPDIGGRGDRGALVAAESRGRHWRRVGTRSSRSSRGRSRR